MNEKQLIKKLNVLKSVEPQQTLLDEIKQNLFRRIEIEERKNSRSISEANLKTIPYTLSFMAFCIGFIFVIASVFFPTQLHNAILNGKLIFASNQYEKAKIALEDITSHYGSQTVHKNNANSIAYSLNDVNYQMSKLTLKGEPGKYTAKQCHDLYQNYYNFLKQEQNNTPQSFTTLRSRLNLYQEQAEQKLNMYHNL